ncbi:hypothetical protein AVEN_176036-1 [Araneus ventricosus]|uniref:Uncharacterized protein n=1 Tax=Araneus ventricosus TaxID=182803 RepID=A0A4Y2UVV6_ARAVE|nr:hypothetical protein AVEN_176036-1 [Araneus ventricosus]
MHDATPTVRATKRREGMTCDADGTAQKRRRHDARRRQYGHKKAKVLTHADSTGTKGEGIVATPTVRAQRRIARRRAVRHKKGEGCMTHADSTGTKKGEGMT